LLPVFLIDEHQAVRPNEIGTLARLRETCADNGVEMHQVDLNGQFRCGGSEAYVRWVEGLLGLRADGAQPWTGDEALHHVPVRAVQRAVPATAHRSVGTQPLTCISSPGLNPYNQNCAATSGNALTRPADPVERFRHDREPVGVGIGQHLRLIVWSKGRPRLQQSWLIALENRAGKLAAIYDLRHGAGKVLNPC
jgi:hypothetical protein